jgi:hypothetical protein
MTHWGQCVDRTPTLTLNDDRSSGVGLKPSRYLLAGVQHVLQSVS